MRYLTLGEFQTTEDVELSPGELRDLRAVAPSVAVAPSIGHPGRYDVTPGASVGAINLGTIAIEIRPKLPIDRVLFLVSYALDPRQWRIPPFELAPEATLVEAMIPGFVAQVRRAVAHGMLHGYRTEEDTLTVVRGRLRVNDQVRWHFGLFPPVEVTFDDFTDDVEENRLIKAAIARLGRLSIRSVAARAALRAFDGVLSNVGVVQYDALRLPDVLYTRLNLHYRPAVEMSKLILRSMSIELRHGDVQANSLLLDMNAVFENFVVVALREALQLSVRDFPQGMHSRPALFLDARGTIQLRPDISWWGEKCLFVGAVKYKRINAVGIVHPDLYQLLTYTIAADVPAGLLVYAAGEGEPASHQVVQVGKVLEVVALQLNGPPEEILSQIGAVAARIRELRTSALASCPV